jgi:hypothetical protein
MPYSLHDEAVTDEMAERQYSLLVHEWKLTGIYRPTLPPGIPRFQELP